MKGILLFRKGKISEISGLFYKFPLFSKLSSECLTVCKFWSYEISQNETRTENPENLKQMDFNAGGFFAHIMKGLKSQRGDSEATDVLTAPLKGRLERCEALGERKLRQAHLILARTMKEKLLCILPSRL